MNRLQTPRIPRPYESPSVELLTFSYEGSIALSDFKPNPIFEEDFDD